MSWISWGATQCVSNGNYRCTTVEFAKTLLIPSESGETERLGGALRRIHVDHGGKSAVHRQKRVKEQTRGHTASRLVLQLPTWIRCDHRN